MTSYQSAGLRSNVGSSAGPQPCSDPPHGTGPRDAVGVPQGTGDYAEALQNYYEALKLEVDPFDRSYILYYQARPRAQIYNCSIPVLTSSLRIFPQMVYWKGQFFPSRISCSSGLDPLCSLVPFIYLLCLLKRTNQTFFPDGVHGKLPGKIFLSKVTGSIATTSENERGTSNARGAEK